MPDESLIQLHTETLLVRLPLGDASIWRAPVMVALCRALATEGARNHEDAILHVLDGFMPDTALEFLPEWEAFLQLVADGLTLEQRRGQIIALLRGNVDPNLANLNGILHALVPGGTVTHLQHKPPAAEFELGADLGTEQATLTVCCLPLVVGSADVEDQSYMALSGVTSLGAVTGRYNEDAQSRSMDADGTVTVSWVGSPAERHRTSLWARADAPFSLSLEYDSAGWVTAQTFTLGTSWTHLVLEIPAGAASLAWRLRAEEAGTAILSWVLTGRHDTALERAVTTALHAPLHAVLEFAMVREYNT